MIRASALSLTILLLAACGPTEAVKCTMANCSGCCTEAGECLASARQSAMECGPAGGTCAACLPGQLCATGRCVKDPDASVVLDDGGIEMPDAGRPDSGVQCGSLGAACCASGSACGGALTCQGNVCRQPVADAGACGALGQNCCTNSTCTALGSTCSAGTCVAQMTTDAGTDGGSPLKSAGEACTADSQCVDATCLQNGFNGGYCTKACTTSANCTFGSWCGLNPTSPIGPTHICLKSCSNPGVAPGGCRSGYVCDANTGAPQPVCYPGCASVTQCALGTPECDSRGFCCGGAGLTCCDGNTCLNGTTCMSGTCRTAGSGGGGGSSATGGGSGTTGGGSGSTGGGSGTTGGGSGSTGGGSGATGGGAGSMALSGSPCSDFSQCVGNRCITGGQWSGGYCSETCAGSAGCRSGSSCSYALFSGSSTRYCLENCVWTGDQSSCRAGYVCERGLIPDQPTNAACFPACTTQSQCGNANLDCESGFCCGLSSYRCCAGSVCRTGSCQPNGYCG